MEASALTSHPTIMTTEQPVVPAWPQWYVTVEKDTDTAVYVVTQFYVFFKKSTEIWLKFCRKKNLDPNVLFASVAILCESPKDRRSKYFKIGHIISCHLKKTGGPDNNSFLIINAEKKSVNLTLDKLDTDRSKVPDPKNLKSLNSLNCKYKVF